MLNKKFQYIFYFILLSALYSCTSTTSIKSITYNATQIDSVNVPVFDTSTYNIITPYKIQIDSEMNIVIGYSTQIMEKDKPEGLLCNFVADLSLEECRKYYNPDDNKNIDMCLLNYGGLRAPLPKGKITVRNIFELMPFENEFFVATLKGEDCHEMFNYIAEAKGEPISGFTLEIKDSTAYNISINNQPFCVDSTYKILTSDYLINGGDRMFFFSKAIDIDTINLKIRDVIMNYIIEKNKDSIKISSKLDNRILYKE